MTPRGNYVQKKERHIIARERVRRVRGRLRLRDLRARLLELGCLMDSILFRQRRKGDPEKDWQKWKKGKSGRVA